MSLKKDKKSKSKLNSSSGHPQPSSELQNTCTPQKNKSKTGLYAGAQFQNSPDPSSIPIPSFVSQSFVSQSPQLSKSMDDAMYRHSPSIPSSYIPMIPPPQPVFNTMMHSSFQSSFQSNSQVMQQQQQQMGIKLSSDANTTLKDSNLDIFNMEMESARLNKGVHAPFNATIIGIGNENHGSMMGFLPLSSPSVHPSTDQNPMYLERIGTDLKKLLNIPKQ